RARVDVDRNAKGPCDGIGGDVVVGRAYAAGGEHVVVTGAERIDRSHDITLHVGDDAHLAEVDAQRRASFGDRADVLVLGAAGQDLVADDQQRRSNEVRRSGF